MPHEVEAEDADHGQTQIWMDRNQRKGRQRDRQHGEHIESPCLPVPKRVLRRSKRNASDPNCDEARSDIRTWDHAEYFFHLCCVAIA